MGITEFLHALDVADEILCDPQNRKQATSAHGAMPPGHLRNRVAREVLDGKYDGVATTTHNQYADGMDEMLLDTRHTATTAVFAGCCEMEIDTWACGNADMLTGTHVKVRDGLDGEWTEYRFVCSLCAHKYGVVEK